MKISVLLAVRPNSPVLAQFLDAYQKNTDDRNTELLICAGKEQTPENLELLGKYDTTYEEKNLGRHGLHLYFNELAERSTGSWILYACEDHEFVMPAWDRYLRNYIMERIMDHTNQIEPTRVNMIVPRFDNTGSVSHMMSRAFYETIGHIAMHSAVDSYLNYLLMDFPGHRIHHMQLPMFTDWTVTKPIERPLIENPDIVTWEDERVNQWISADQVALKAAITAGL